MTKKETLTAADDLDDGLEYEVDFSEQESSIEVGSDFEEGYEDPKDKDGVAKTELEGNSGKKRKVKSSKLQEKKRIKMEMDIEQKKKLSQENVEVIVDYINNKIRHKNLDLSSLELAELYFSKSDIRSTADFNGEKRNLDNLSKFINQKFKNMLPAGGNKKNKNKKNKKNQKLDEKNEGKESPEEERKFIAIVSMSALRACDVHRSTREVSGSSLKLINKNKLEVDLKLVKSTRSRILCCTPGRLIKVLNSENSELKKEEIKIIIVDSTYLDSKCQNIWDIKEAPEVLKTLSKEGGSKIYLY